MNLRETGFSRAADGNVAGRKTPAQEFGRYSDALGKPSRMEAAGAIALTAFNTALDYGKDAIGSILWYGIGLSMMALEKASRIKKGF